MKKKILVVGGVAGGASFAARMRRLDEKAEIIMFEKGHYISFANCGLPYHIGKTIPDRERLIIQTPEKFKARYNVDVRVESEVVSIDTGKKAVEVGSKGSHYREDYDYLLLSPGSMPLRPPIPGIENENIFTLRNIPDMDRIKAALDTKGAKDAVVVGGGFIGLEMAENLRRRGLAVTLVELAGQVFLPADAEMANILHRHLSLNGVKLFLGDGVKEFRNAAKNNLDVLLNSGRVISADMAVLAIGVRPDAGFLKGSGIAVNAHGAIIVNSRMQTNIESIYAVGDAIEVTDFNSGRKAQVPLAGPANRQGRIAADNIAGTKSEYKDTQGTAICRIFDLTAAVTGINEKKAKEYGVTFTKSYTHSPNHATYYPKASSLSVKILFNKKTHKLLGAQIIGKDGVDKRIDVFATAIRNGLTVYDLTELELAYAPPFGSAKDAVNMAGFVAQNIIEDKVDVFYAEEVAGIDSQKQILLDVRTEGENKNGAIEGSKLIPVDSLRQRLGELNKNKEIMVYCQVGLRGYFACRILSQNGFKAKNLSGGYKTYSSFQAPN